MRKKALQVTLEVREPSTVELTVGEKVQLDRLSESPRGYVAERHDKLLDRGLTRLSLEPGLYFFRTLSNANLEVVRGGVTARAAGDGGKDLPPPPLVPGARGDEPAGDVPTFTIICYADRAS